MKDNKKKILKIIQVVYDIISAVFIIFVCVAMAIAPKSDNHSEVKEKPNRLSLNVNDDNYKHLWTLKDTFNATSWTCYNNGDKYWVSFTDNAVTYVNQNYNYAIKVNVDNVLIYNNTGSYYDNHYQYLTIEIYNYKDTGASLHSIYLTHQNGSTLSLWEGGNFVNKVSLLINDYSFDFSNLTPVDDFNYLSFFDLFFNLYSSEDIYFNFDDYDVNPINYYSYEIMSDNTAHNTGSWTGHIDLSMVFVSNGRTFKAMRFQYDYVLGTYYKDILTTYDNMTYLALSYIAYQDYYSGEWVKVCYPRIYKYETRSLNNASQLAGYPFTDFNTYLWANDGYKSIIIVNGSTNVFSTAVGDPIADLNNIQVLTYQGSLNKSVPLGGSGNYDVFSLLYSSFASLGGIFSIMIVPGLTIGTLLFLPLVVIVIITIIKVLHK